MEVPEDQAASDHRGEPIPAADPRPDLSRSRIDIWSKRAAAWAQIGTLIVVTVGYLVTVRPAFQYQLLQEKEAKLQLKFGIEQARLESMSDARARYRKELSSINKRIADANSQRLRLIKTLHAAEARETEASARALLIKKVLAHKRTQLDKVTWKLLIIALSAAQVRNVFLHISDSDCHLGMEGHGFSCFKEHWPRPYNSLITALTEIKVSSKGADVYPPAYFAELQRYIEKRRAELTCKMGFFNKTKMQYHRDIEAVTPIVDRQLAAYIAKLKNKRGLFTRVVISKNYRNAARNNIWTHYATPIVTRYELTLLERASSCAGRVDLVMRSFMKSKGILSNESGTRSSTPSDPQNAPARALRH